MALKVLENRIVLPMFFEVVRDRIAEIIVNELLNQITLAIADSAPIEPYEIAVTTEKTDPFSKTQFPLVNVWYDTGNIDTSASSPANEQQGDHFYNLDCYVEKPSEDDGGDIISGDTLSAKEVQRVAGLIWQIIMADQNARLQFPSREVGPITSKADPGNTGNGTVTEEAASATGAPARFGIWVLTCTQAIADSGRFNLVDPDGIEVENNLVIPAGPGNNVVFDGFGLTFKLTDGTTDFALNDFFEITVETGKPSALVAYRIFE